MKAIGAYKALPIDDPESLVEVDIAMPQAAGRDLLVQVKAVSVNPVDIKTRQRLSGEQTEPHILGYDAAGIVTAVGPDVSLFKVGDEVYYAGDITRPGCDSQYHLVDERIVGHKPASLSFEQAAAMPLTSITAWEALFERLGVPQSPAANTGQSVLIIGGAGGVGSIAIQMAKKLAGLRVIATASRPESTAWCRELGADEIIDHHQSFSEQLKRAGLNEVDYILCFNSLETHAQNMSEVIKPQGKICSIVGTAHNQPLNVNLFFGKSVALMWELMFTRARYQTPDMQQQHYLLNETARLLDKGVLRTTLTEHYGPLTAETLRQAHARLETGAMIGKLVLSGFN